MTLVAASYWLVRVTAVCCRESHLSSLEQNFPPKVLHKPVTTFEWHLLKLSKGEWATKRTTDPKANKTDTSSSEENTSHWFAFDLSVYALLKISSCIFFVFRATESSESAELQRKPRCGRSQRWPIKLPLGRRVSAGWWTPPLWLGQSGVGIAAVSTWTSSHPRYDDEPDLFDWNN